MLLLVLFLQKSLTAKSNNNKVKSEGFDKLTEGEKSNNKMGILLLIYSYMFVIFLFILGLIIYLSH